MDIGPVDNAKPLPERGDAKQNRAAPEENPAPDQKDELDLSKQARDLLKESAKTDGVNHERLREIKQRIDRGYYSRPKVTKKIADKLLGEESVEVDFLRAKYPVFFEGIPEGDSDSSALAEEDNNEE
jgi:anti-sigma28 factor (negative regulator of flagellin synthesis)